MVTYDRAFYETTAEWSISSARAILPLLIGATGARSIVDVGCGNGPWLAVAGELGVADVLGLDGSYVQPASLLMSPERFRAVDVAQPFELERQFDLVLCLEVAEHLPPARSESLVDDLIRLGPIVAFSAAIPGQGGVDHRNERWPDYWHGLFAQVGYRAVDLVRAAVWDRDDVAPWYAQNMFVFAAGDAQLETDAAALPVRVVHPEIFSYRLAFPPPDAVRAQIGPMARDFLGFRLKRLLRR